MNPVPLLLVLLLTFAFETAFIGDQVQQTIQPFLWDVSTEKEVCDDGLDGIPCSIENSFRPVLKAAATIFNAIIYIGGLATFNVPGAPSWVRATMGTGVTLTLVWCLVELLRGKGS